MKRKKRQKPTLHFQIGFLYGVLCMILFAPTVQGYLRTQELQSLDKKPSLPVFTEGKPVRVFIPRVGVDVSVIPGSYTLRGWDVSPTEALFATATTLPNNRSGNTLIYGHNTSSVFLKTAGLEKGDKLFVFTDHRHIFVYTYDRAAIVAPTDVSILSYNGAPQVTLLTCNGIFDEHRKLMMFRFLKAV